jgi:hypothetical protein
LKEQNFDRSEQTLRVEENLLVTTDGPALFAKCSFDEKVLG